MAPCHRHQSLGDVGPAEMVLLQREHVVGTMPIAVQDAVEISSDLLLGCGSGATQAYRSHEAAKQLIFSHWLPATQTLGSGTNLFNRTSPTALPIPIAGLDSLKN